MKPTHRRTAEPDFDALERMLQSSLHPVTPRNHFRSGLHTRLSQTPVPPPSPFRVIQYVIIALGAVAAVALLVVAGARLVLTLLGSLGLLQQMRTGRLPDIQAHLPDVQVPAPLPPPAAL
jgi:hypothetical protein